MRRPPIAVHVRRSLFLLLCRCCLTAWSSPLAVRTLPLCTDGREHLPLPPDSLPLPVGMFSFACFCRGTGTAEQDAGLLLRLRRAQQKQEQLLRRRRGRRAAEEVPRHEHLRRGLRWRRQVRPLRGNH